MTASLHSHPSHDSQAHVSLTRRLGFWLASFCWYAGVVIAYSLLQASDIARLSVFYICLAVPFAIPLVSLGAMVFAARRKHAEVAWGIGAAYGSNLILAIGSALLVPSVNGVTGALVLVLMSALGWPMWLSAWLGR